MRLVSRGAVAERERCLDETSEQAYERGKGEGMEQERANPSTWVDTATMTKVRGPG